MTDFQFIFSYVKKHGVRYIFGFITLLIVDYSLTYIPKFTGVITDGLEKGNMDKAGILHYTLLILGLGVLIALGRFLWRFFFFGAARSIEKELRNDLYKHLETLDVEYYHENKTGDLMSRFTSDMEAVRTSVGIAFVAAFDASVMTIMVLYQMIFYVNLKLTLITLIPMLLILGGMFLYGQKMHARFLKRQEAVSDLTDFVQENISGVRVVKAFVQEKAQAAFFAKYNKNTKAKNLKVAGLQSIVIPILEFLIGLSTLITLVFGGYLTLKKQISLGQFVAYNQYIHMLVWPMIACGDSIQNVSKGMASVKRIHDIMKQSSKLTAPSFVAEEEVATLKGNISFQDMSFTYPGNEAPTLSHITFDVKAGETLAIVGRTGSGKTTLVDLLIHLYNVEPGMITLDGMDINAISLKSLRQQIGFVPQDEFMFSDTIKGNIAFGMEEVDMEEIERAAKLACVHENIIDFPHGYETIVGERGVTLSGGQKQRSSIARAWIKDAPILILDDSLSAVDTDTEERILKNLHGSRAGKTTILIAHRISTIQNADKIVVLDEGKLAEIGNHDELMEKNGIYREMFEMQQLEAMRNTFVEEA